MKFLPEFLILLIFAAAAYFIGPEAIISSWSTLLNKDSNEVVEAPQSPARAEESLAPAFIDSPVQNAPTVQRQAKQPKPTKRVFQWTDTEGNIHFGDAPGEDASNLQEKKNLFTYSNAFQLNIVAIDHNLPLDINHKLELAVEKIYEIYHTSIGVNYEADPYINLKLYRDFDQFKHYRSQHAPELAASVGFYVPANNEAVVYNDGNFERTLRIITHESSHAILNYQKTSVPAWLNEGLAEYFENMELFGQAFIIHPNKEWDMLLHKNRDRIAEEDFLHGILTADYETWYGMNEDNGMSYAVSWSLVYYLMSTASGRKTLQALLTEFGKTRQIDKEIKQLFEQHYYGGYEQLQERWVEWLRKSKSSHRY